jgi:Gnt-I system high-affinity gluconate transporter
MTILIICLCIVALVLMITWLRINAFLSFLVISIITGLLLGIPLSKITHSVQVGLGDTLGSLVIIIVTGAMLGKLVADTGAAQKITSVLMKLFGEKNIQLALMVTGFIVGIPLFYQVGFVLMVPLIFSVTYQFRLPVVYTGLPMLASMSVTHGFLPPHPSPTALVSQFHADMGLTLLLGLAVAIPTIIVAGPIFAKTVRNIHSEPLRTFQPVKIEEDRLPGAFNSIMTALLPVLLLSATTIIGLSSHLSPTISSLVAFFGDPQIVMLLSLAVGTVTLGLRNGHSMRNIMTFYAEATKDIAMILLIVSGAGALKQVFIDSGVSQLIGNGLQTIPIHPLVLGWLMAGVIRACMGSATVAGLTTAGIISPVLSKLHVHPSLMVLAIGAGSLMFSHVNDPGFWMFKEYFNVSIKNTLRSWSLMETLVGVVGITGVLILNFFM